MPVPGIEPGLQMVSLRKNNKVCTLDLSFGLLRHNSLLYHWTIGANYFQFAQSCTWQNPNWGNKPWYSSEWN